MSQTFDAIIIGAGTAGLAALREVRKRHGSVLIVNDGPWGTTCARVGCMPSKMLIEAAHAFHRRHAFDTFGIRGASHLQADLPAALQRVRALRDELVAGTVQVTEDLGEQAVSGRARLLDAHRVEVNGREYRAKAVVIATGSRPTVPPDWLAFGDRILTTDTLFEQPTLGPRIAVIGLGPLGLEMAQALSRLGLEVAAFSSSPQVGGLRDPAVSEAMLGLLKQEFAIHIGGEATVREVPGGVEVTAGRTTVVVDQVLAAMGRRPNLEHLGLETLGVPLDDKGVPKTDPRTLQVGHLLIFLAGDADDDRPLLHEASDEGHIAGINAMAPEPRGFRRRTPLGIVFGEPQAAFVGQRFDALPAGKTVTGQVDFSRQGRARVALRNAGRLHVYADKDSGRLLGAELCAPDGEHIAHWLALGISQELTVQDLLRAPFYHPVLEEGVRTALRDAAAQLPKASDSDLASCEPIGASALDG